MDGAGDCWGARGYGDMIDRAITAVPEVVVVVVAISKSASMAYTLLRVGGEVLRTRSYWENICSQRGRLQSPSPRPWDTRHKTNSDNVLERAPRAISKETFYIGCRAYR